jgi:hypothetical protein
MQEVTVVHFESASCCKPFWAFGIASSQYGAFPLEVDLWASAKLAKQTAEQISAKVILWKKDVDFIFSIVLMVK